MQHFFFPDKPLEVRTQYALFLSLLTPRLHSVFSTCYVHECDICITISQSETKPSFSYPLLFSSGTEKFLRNSKILAIKTSFTLHSAPTETECTVHKEENEDTKWCFGKAYSFVTAIQISLSSNHAVQICCFSLSGTQNL